MRVLVAEWGKVFIWISWKRYALFGELSPPPCGKAVWTKQCAVGWFFCGRHCRKSGGKWRKVFKRNFENATHFSANWILFRSWSWKIIWAYLCCFGRIVSKNVFQKWVCSAWSCCNVGKSIYMNFLKTLRTFRWIESPYHATKQFAVRDICGIAMWRKVFKRNFENSTQCVGYSTDSICDQRYPYTDTIFFVFLIYSEYAFFLKQWSVLGRFAALSKYYIWDSRKQYAVRRIFGWLQSEGKIICGAYLFCGRRQTQL